MTYITTRYERTKLYEEVWAESVTAVSKRYGISDVALREICQKLAVPLPPRGETQRARRVSPGVDVRQSLRTANPEQTVRAARLCVPANREIRGRGGRRRRCELGVRHPLSV